MALTREEIDQIARRVASNIISNYHPPESIEHGLAESVGEADAAVHVYLSRASDAANKGDDLTARYYRDVAGEERKNRALFGNRYKERLETPVLAKKKPTRDDVEIHTWMERDRLHIEIRDRKTEKTVAEWWDEDAEQMCEDGFFKPGHERHQEIEGADFENSVLEYAEEMGMLSGGKIALLPRVKPEYFKVGPPTHIEEGGIKYEIHNTFETKSEVEWEVQDLKDHGHKTKVKPHYGGYAVYVHYVEEKLPSTEDAEVMMKRLQKEVRDLWIEMCEFDKVDPNDSFVVHSEKNPYRQDYNRKNAEYQKWLRIITAGGGLHHIAKPPTYLNAVKRELFDDIDLTGVPDHSPFRGDVPKDTVKKDLVKSVAEEAKAVADYEKRGKVAESVGDSKTAAIYEHVAKEEAHHKDEFVGRVGELGIKLLPDSPEFLAATIVESGWREKLDDAFQAAVTRVRGG